jgi:hypothetical protein
MIAALTNDVACGNEVTCGKWRLLNISEIKANYKFGKA